MRKLFFWVFIILLISLANFVLADDDNQLIRCYNNGDCGPSVAGYKFSCSDNNWSCSGPYETPFCDNPGTVNSSCKTITSPGTCQLCPNGCKDGSCIQINNIKCYKNEDCGSGTSTAFCSGNSACSTSTTPTCLNPGTNESQCSSVSTTGCSSPCKYGCKNGACVVKNEQCKTDADCPQLCPTCGIDVVCPCTKYKCYNGECKPETIQTCVEGSTKKYVCIDGLEVNWCTCNNGNWVCVISPEIKCKKEIDAYLNQKFELKSQQTAIIRDYKDMKVKYVASSTCSCPTCGVGVACQCPPCKLEIKVQVEMPSGGNTETGTEFSLSVGERKNVFDVTISLIDLSNGVAVLLVSKENCPKGCICSENIVSCPACQEGYVYDPGTQKCDPLVYNCPEGCICNENTTSCPSNTTITKKGYRFAYWKCYNREESRSEDTTSCKSAEIWKNYATQFCDACAGEKCGVASFSVWNECYWKETSSNATTYPIEEYPIEECKIDVDCGLVASLCGDPTGPNYQSCVERPATKNYKCVNGKCIIPGQNKTGKSQGPILFCKDSCPLDNKCYPFGYRKDNKFCSDEGKFIEQLKGDKTCENNFECSSNVCVSGKCISEGFLQKILNWFKKLFG